MSQRNIFTKLRRYHQRLTGSTVEYDLTAYQNILNEIKKCKSILENKSDDRLKDISQTLKKRALSDECLDNLLIESFALVHESIWRVLKLHPFYVQIIGGLVINHGKLAEMQTGEGKTMTAVFPVYLNALSDKGVHILTFNDYLARRDAQWMGPVYNFLGLSVGFVQERMSISDRQKAYNSDITYLTAKESGFDFLRDSLCYNKADIVQRDFNYAIIDEADSILIDEARIPLIIAEDTYDHIADSHYMAKVIKQLEEEKDFGFDEYGRNIHFTEEGIKKIESILKCDNLYNEENLELLTRLNCAIHAEYLLHLDVDYIVRNGKLELVDEFTGRVADKRRWPDGLQAALEAKENIDIQSKGKILNSITLQHFLQLYPKIAGMTATAQASEKELRQFYNLQIVVIPPNKPCKRKDIHDIIYRTKELKFEALINEIVKVHYMKRPILVGTRSVEESVTLALALQKRGIKCEVLNAKRDEYEAKIVAQAGRLKAVTISTNMAGRGTDIRLGGADEDEKDQVMLLGGLYVIGTNRYESQRIDNQLRGRAGRQGDSGSSRFFISLEDDLFVKYKLKDLFPKNLIIDQKDHRIDNPVVKNEINRVQRIVEGQNLEIKKTVWKYSSLIEQQRKIISQQRKDILSNDSVMELFQKISPDQFNRLSDKIGNEKLINLCRYLSLYWLDNSWAYYLAEINDVRDGIHFRRLGGQDPIYEFHKLAIEIFNKLQDNIKSDTIQSFNKIEIINDNIDLDNTGLKAPSSTWTYLVNDNSFEEMLGVILISNVGFSIWAGLYGPIIVLYAIWKKLYGKFKMLNYK
jgi:preprotein translocase subunit SecA